MARMSDAYDTASTVQMAVCAHAAHIICDILETHPLPTAGTVAWADHGCASGGNALHLIRQVKESVQASGRAVHAMLTDLPHNDFNAVLANRARELVPAPFYLSVAAGSFFEQLLPAQSLDVAVSFSAVHWLSGGRNLGPAALGGACYLSQAVPDARAALEEMAAADLDRFLVARAAELRPGGVLVFSALGELPDGRAGAHRVCGQLGALIQGLVDEGSNGVQWRERDDPGLFIPVFPRSAEAVRAAACRVAASGLELVSAQAVDLGDPLARRLAAGELTPEEHARETCAFVRAWSEDPVSRALEHGVEAVYAALEAAVLAAPAEWEFDNVNVFVSARMRSPAAEDEGTDVGGAARRRTAGECEA